jgi:nickel-dependent lactate racemase
MRKTINAITLPQLVWYGNKKVRLALPDGWHAEFYNMEGHNRPALKPAKIKSAIANPIGTAPIHELARGKNEVVIIFDDMTRVTRTSKILPFVLKELAQAGIPDSRIRFICALGNHGSLNRLDFAKKLGEDVLARFPVYNHNPFANCTHIGTTSYGTQVYINAEVMKCDFKIGIGSVVPHPVTGFGGGGKLILPGVSSIETALSMHILQARARAEKWAKSAGGMGVSENNPAREDVEEAAIMAGIDFKIDCLVNMWGETTAVFAGALKPAYSAALTEAKFHYRTLKTKDERVIIANTFAKANEGIMIGLDTAFRALGPKGGDAVLITNAPDGQVTHYLMGYFGKGSAAALPLKVSVPQQIDHLIIYSEYSDLTGREYVEQSEKVSFMSDWDAVIRALSEWHEFGTKVAVYPGADIQYLV